MVHCCHLALLLHVSSLCLALVAVGGKIQMPRFWVPEVSDERDAQVSELAYAGLKGNSGGGILATGGLVGNIWAGLLP